MKLTRIARYVDLLFCLVIMPLVITLLPVDRWIVHNTAFLLTLVVYIYGLYFIYRRTACSGGPPAGGPPEHADPDHLVLLPRGDGLLAGH